MNLSLTFNLLSRGISPKKKVFFRALRAGGGGDAPARSVGTIFRSAFLVNKRSLFPPTCQQFELWTVFRLFVYSILYNICSIFSHQSTFQS